MCADWLKNYYAKDKYLDYDKAMVGGYGIPQMNTLIQQAAALRMPASFLQREREKRCFMPWQRMQKALKNYDVF